jgi:hypothetical protein
MNTIFANLVAEGKVAVYLDNILIFTATREEHCRITRKVLKCLQDNDLYLRPEKCKFKKESVCHSPRGTVSRGAVYALCGAVGAGLMCHADESKRIRLV